MEKHVHNICLGEWAIRGLQVKALGRQPVGTNWMCGEPGKHSLFGCKYAAEGASLTNPGIQKGFASVLWLSALLLSIYGPLTAKDPGRDSTQTTEVVEMGSRLELMVDRFLVSALHGDISFKRHQPKPENVAILHDKPWEGTGSYHTVFKDNGIIRMYYAVQGKDLICYAESIDGISFTKPELGLVEFEGSKANNIIWKGGPISHNLTPFKDPNPDCPPGQRYKALGGTDASGLFALISPDGIRWTKLGDKPVLTDGHFDSQNLAFWDNDNGVYRAFYRDWHREDPPRRLRGITTDRVVRGIKTATSKDFIHWSKGEWLEFSGPAGRTRLEKVHLYTNAIGPYWRAPHILFGFPVRYVERSFGPSSRALPNADAHERRMRRIERENAQTEALMITSRDGRLFEYDDEAFLRPGLRRNNWVYGNNYVAWHLIESSAAEPERNPEISLYATESTNLGAQTANQLRRYTLRLDGFASLHAPLAGGEMVTRPIRFQGERMVINYSTSAAGSVRIEILDTDDVPLPGYTLSEFDEIYGDQLDRTITWQGRRDISGLQGKTIRLRFVLADADVYSFVFRS